MNARRPYQRPMAKTSWFLGHARYKNYMLHEVSSLFVGLYMALLIYGLIKLGNGPDAWANFIDFVKSPIVVILSLIAFAFFIIHTVSWFQAVPQAMRIQQGEHFVPGNIIVGAHYAALAAFSLFVLILAGVA
jgi:fumarate reductase subunit C